MIETWYKRPTTVCGKVCQKCCVSLENPRFGDCVPALALEVHHYAKDTDIILTVAHFFPVPGCLDHIFKWFCAVAVEYMASSSPTQMCRGSLSVSTIQTPHLEASQIYTQ